MNNFEGFLSWCKSNNFSLLQFKKSINSQKEYCNFIEKNYKSKSMLESVERTETFFNKLSLNELKYTNYKYLTTNMRMSICELG
jgi:hypothetical protein